MNLRLGTGRLLCVAALAVLSVLAPLWVYALSLALFGLPHVAVELRYVDQRFAARAGRRLVRGLGALLLGIALLRAAGVFGLGSGSARAAIELLLGTALVAAVWSRLAAHGALVAAVGAALLGLALWSASAAPVPALVVFALLHNLTPVAFLAERLRGLERRRALLVCALVFGLVPAAIALGAVAALLAPWGLSSSWSGPPGVGELDLHLGAFVPEPLRHGAFAVDLFAAAAFLQCMHHAVVLGVLPRLGGGAETAGAAVRWPERRAFVRGVVFAGAALTVAFAVSFADARAAYGVFASVHAWVEVPVLLLAWAATARDGAMATEVAA